MGIEGRDSLDLWGEGRLLARPGGKLPLQRQLLLVRKTSFSLFFFPVMVPSRKRGSERKALCWNASSAKAPKVKKLYDDNDLKYTILDVINRRTNGKRASLCVERVLSDFGFTDSRHSHNKRQGMEISVFFFCSFSEWMSPGRLNDKKLAAFRSRGAYLLAHL